MNLAMATGRTIEDVTSLSIDAFYTSVLSLDIKKGDEE